MSAVELRFSALPEHVRTARLVAVAVARLVGVEESVVDEVRLLVGEACSWAVGLQQRRTVPRPVRVTLLREEARFVEVGDSGPPRGSLVDAVWPRAVVAIGRRTTRWAWR